MLKKCEHPWFRLSKNMSMSYKKIGIVFHPIEDQLFEARIYCNEGGMIGSRQGSSGGSRLESIVMMIMLQGDWFI